MVADQLLIPLSLCHLVWLARDATRDKGVTDTNEAFLYEIHLVNFLVFIVNNVIVYIILKAAGQEALCDHIEQPYILLPVMLCIIKKSSKCCYHIPKQIINCNLKFDLVWHIV